MRARTIDAAGAELFVREWGDRNGGALLFWHGLGDHTGLQIGEAAPILADEFGLRVLALDAPGFGASPRPPLPDYYLLPALADRALVAADALALARPAFVGASWGGLVGVTAAARRPERLAALVLLDAGYIAPERTHETREELRAYWAQQPGFRYASWEEVMHEARNYFPRLTPAIEAAGRTAFREEGDEIVSVMGPETYAAALWGIHQTPLDDALPALGATDLPVLLLAATEPREWEAERRARLERFAELVPQARIERVAGAHHALLESSPEEVARAVGGWLRSLPYA